MAMGMFGNGAQKGGPDLAAMMGGLTGASAGGAPQFVRKMTKEEKDFETAQREVDKMKKECAKFETPETYAKFGKMQRQIVKMEKEVKKLKVLADESQNRPEMVFTEENKEEADYASSLLEEAKNTEDEPEMNFEAPAAVPSTGMSMKAQLHIAGTFLFTLVCYIIPLTFTSYLFTSDRSQSVHTLVS